MTNVHRKASTAGHCCWPAMQRVAMRFCLPITMRTGAVLLLTICCWSAAGEYCLESDWDVARDRAPPETQEEGAAVEQKQDIYFGMANGKCADVDGDMVSDILVGAPQIENSVGRVHLFSGKTGDLIVTIGGDEGESTFGWSVTQCADVDGDGALDVAIGCPRMKGQKGYSGGHVILYSLHKNQRIAQLEGDPKDLMFGRRLTSLVGRDAGSCEELIIASWRAQANDASLVRPIYHVYSISKRAILMTIDLSQSDETSFDAARVMGMEWGDTCTPLGDIDSDGRADLAVSVPCRGKSHGRIVVISGESGSILREFHGTSERKILGPVAHLGSLGDGLRCNIAIVVDGIAPSGDARSRRAILNWSFDQDVCLWSTVGVSAVYSVEDVPSPTVAAIRNTDSDCVCVVIGSCYLFDWSIEVLSCGEGKSMGAPKNAVEHFAEIIDKKKLLGRELRSVIAVGDCDQDGVGDIALQLFCGEIAPSEDQGILVLSGASLEALFHLRPIMR